MPNSSGLDQKLYKEISKTEKTKIIMKNVIKNQILADRHVHELKKKIRDKEKKHKEAAKQMQFHKEMLERQRSEKKQKRMDMVKAKLERDRKVCYIYSSILANDLTLYRTMPNVNVNS